jgi:lysophospholipase L1-like esterase
VTILLGTNDATDCNWARLGSGVQFEADALAMVKIIKALNPPPKVYLGVPPPIGHPPPSRTDRTLGFSESVANSTYPVLIRKIAKEAGVDGVFDTFNALGGNDMDPELICDGIHPTNDGLGIIARSIAAEVDGVSLEEK